MADLLTVKNLKVDFSLDGRVVHAVEGVDLRLERNETVVLAGESGSGKTITALALTGILPSNAAVKAGEVILEGENILGLSEKRLSLIRGAKIAYIFQEPTSYLNPVYTIGEQISEVIMQHQGLGRQEAGEKAGELLAQVQISDTGRVFRSYPHQLSGGMNQRVFIAMALACRPAIIIADEPTTSLDVTIEAQILKLLVELKEKTGFSLLFITHNLAIAKKIAARIYVMYRGKIVEEGYCGQIFENPAHFHTKELIAAYHKIGRL
ncbi:MAG: ABC transporter ATP-binding protein [Candidatus Omnitrophica bacterium]|jgi:ABC-type dipeptide/oligopeptide/nickel transport system ATPase component|nr:ABC transporter ATP-binding protein [Candidatus Omnitrophota bacterium]